MRNPRASLVFSGGMKLHPRSQRLETESAFEVLARAKELERSGRSIVHLEIGQPDFPTPRHIADAAIAAIRDGKTGYGPTPGIPELREAIAEDSRARRGVSVSPEQVIVTPGAKPVMYYAIESLCGEGDEVIYPDPGFPMYRSIVAHSGATGVPLPLREEHEFRFDADEFRALVSDRTRLIILNSPHNPTGGSLTRDDLNVVAEASAATGAVVLSDEIYIRFVYDGAFATIAALPGMDDRTIILDGFSKSYSMTGWRVGYAIVPPALVQAFERYNVNVVSCAATFNQWGALAALEGPQDPVEAMVDEFRARRDLLVAGLNRIRGVSCRVPRGAFYAFPSIKETGRSAADIAHDLLEDAGVAVLPGTAFGDHGEGHLRLSYAASRAQLAEAIERMERHFG